MRVRCGHHVASDLWYGHFMFPLRHESKMAYARIMHYALLCTSLPRLLDGGGGDDRLTKLVPTRVAWWFPLGPLSTNLKSPSSHRTQPARAHSSDRDPHPALYGCTASMRIHEILEACLEYVAFEGVLGQYLSPGSNPGSPSYPPRRAETSSDISKLRVSRA